MAALWIPPFWHDLDRKRCRAALATALQKSFSSACQGGVYGLDHILVGERLRQRETGTKTLRQYQVIVCIITPATRHRDNLDVATTASQLEDHFYPLFVRHNQVGDDEIRPLFPKTLQRFFSVAGFLDLMADIFQYQPKH
jgi:hypothetical protein